RLFHRAERPAAASLCRLATCAARNAALVPPRLTGKLTRSKTMPGVAGAESSKPRSGTPPGASKTQPRPPQILPRGSTERGKLNTFKGSSRWGRGISSETPRYILCAKRTLPGLCWRNAPFHPGGEVMARPPTELILEHIRRLAGPDAAAGPSDAELLRRFL